MFAQRFWSYSSSWLYGQIGRKYDRAHIADRIVCHICHFRKDWMQELDTFNHKMLLCQMKPFQCSHAIVCFSFMAKEIFFKTLSTSFHLFREHLFNIGKKCVYIKPGKMLLLPWKKQDKAMNYVLCDSTGTQTSKPWKLTIFHLMDHGFLNPFFITVGVSTFV